MNLEAAGCLMQIEKKIVDGPFYCGDNTNPGKIVCSEDSIYHDNIKRYTDKYKTSRQLGNTIDTYPFVTEYFPLELQKFLGVKSQAKRRKVVQDSQISKIEQAIIDATVAVDDANENEEDDKEEEQPDEFEDFDDDDYNAEQYFDDGEDRELDEDAEADYS